STPKEGFQRIIIFFERGLPFRYETMHHSLPVGAPLLSPDVGDRAGVRFQLILAFPSWEILVKFCNGCDLCTCASCVRSGIRGVRGRGCSVFAGRAQCAGRESSLTSSCQRSAASCQLTDSTGRLAAISLCESGLCDKCWQLKTLPPKSAQANDSKE